MCCPLFRVCWTGCFHQFFHGWLSFWFFCCTACTALYWVAAPIDCICALAVSAARHVSMAFSNVRFGSLKSPSFRHWSFILNTIFTHNLWSCHFQRCQIHNLYSFALSCVTYFLILIDSAQNWCLTNTFLFFYYFSWVENRLWKLQTFLPQSVLHHNQCELPLLVRAVKWLNFQLVVKTFDVYLYSLWCLSILAKWRTGSTSDTML